MIPRQARYLLFLLPHRRNLGTRLTKSPKLYFIFAGLNKWRGLAGEAAGQPHLVYAGDEPQQRTQARVLPWHQLGDWAATKIVDDLDLADHAGDERDKGSRPSALRVVADSCRH